MRWTTQGSADGRTRTRPVWAFLLPTLLLSGAVAFASDGVRILVDGRTVTAPEAATVREALSAAKVSVDADDEVSPALSSPVPADGVIRVSRVSYQQVTTDEKIPYKIVIQPASKGNRPYHPTVTRNGVTGLKKITYRAKLVDGREVERATLSEEVVRQPVNAVVTARNPKQLGSRGAYAGSRTITVIATAYDPGPGSCGKYANGKTTNGKRAGYGIIAVDPKVIPLGAKLHVEGYGYGIAADVGGAIKGNRVDLGFNSRPAAFKWGKRVVKLTIVD